MKKQLSASESKLLLGILQSRFEKNMFRHQGLVWDDVQKKLVAQPEKLWTLQEMENTGGEPDVVGKDKKTGAYLFFDCVAETPKGRRSVCYDNDALESRKEHKPKTSAWDMAEQMGVRVLNEAEYRHLQSLQPVDTKTSSWLATPSEIRELGGAIFGDYRYGQVFIYHNGAESYYAARGFRAVLTV
jgi:hypothetical protein